MATARESLEEASANLDESLGVRQHSLPIQLAPVPHRKDTGRLPNRRFGSLRIDQIIADPGQPRTDFPDEALDRLVRSIQERGQLTPIRVRWSDEHQKWVIIFGERRWRAACRAGLTSIDCHFHESALSTSEILEQQLIENCLREDLQPMEEARAFVKLIEMNGWTGKQLADTLRITPSRVSRTLALLRLPQDVQDQVDAGMISARAAQELAKLDAPQVQQGLARRIAAGELNVAQTERAVRQRKGKPKPAPRGTRQVFVADDGWKVTVTGPQKGTYHHIELALSLAIEEVRHRIEQGRPLF